MRFCTKYYLSIYANNIINTIGARWLSGLALRRAALWSQVRSQMVVCITKEAYYSLLDRV